MFALSGTFRSIFWGLRLYFLLCSFPRTVITLETQIAAKVSWSFRVHLMLNSFFVNWMGIKIQWTLNNTGRAIRGSWICDMTLLRQVGNITSWVNFMKISWMLLRKTAPQSRVCSENSSESFVQIYILSLLRSLDYRSLRCLCCYFCMFLKVAFEVQDLDLVVFGKNKPKCSCPIQFWRAKCNVFILHYLFGSIVSRSFVLLVTVVVPFASLAHSLARNLKHCMVSNTYSFLAL